MLPAEDGTSKRIGLPSPASESSVSYITQSFNGSVSHFGALFYSLDIVLDGFSASSPYTLSNLLSGDEEFVASLESVADGEAGISNIGNYLTVSSDIDGGEELFATVMHIAPNGVDEDALQATVGETGISFGYHIHIGYANEAVTFGGSLPGVAFAKEQENSPVSFDTALGSIFVGVVTDEDYTLSSNLKTPNGTDIEDNVFLIGEDNVDATGNDQDNILSGNSANNTISGLGGSDRIWAGYGNDIIFGEENAPTSVGSGDLIYAGFGQDSVNGGGGDDWIFGDSGESILPGNLSSDEQKFLASRPFLLNPIVGSSTDEPLDQTILFDFRYGDTTTIDGNDDLRGDAGDDIIFGGEGNDTIFGGGWESFSVLQGENDVLFGGKGDDHLFGELGDDIIFGGEGSDTAYFESAETETFYFFLTPLNDGGIQVEQVATKAGTSTFTNGKDILYDVEWLKFSDGTVVETSKITAPTTAISATGDVSAADLEAEGFFGTILVSAKEVSGSVWNFFFPKAEAFYEQVPSSLPESSVVAVKDIETGNIYELASGIGTVQFADSGILPKETLFGSDPSANETRSFFEAVNDFGLSDGSEVAQQFLESLGITIDDVTYTGSENAAFLVGEFEIPGTSIDYQGGIMLSSGGFPGPSNTDSGFTVSHFTPGDSDLDIVAQQAFPGAGLTQDASILEFRLFVDDPSQLSFDLVFGSDEYPEFANSSFVDVAAVFVNGENVALFPGSDAPLSITNENVLNNLADNRNAVFAVEWDGFAALGLTANLDAGWNDIKVGVADTGDTALDTAIYLTDFELVAREQDDDAPTGEVRLKNVGGPLDNNLVASNTPEEHTFYEPSSPSEPNVPGSLSGTASSFNNDIVTNFKSDDEIKINLLQQIDLLKQAADLLQQLINLKKGSAIVEIDEDLDGNVDSVLTLEGDFENSRFKAEIVQDDVVLTLEELNLVEGTDGRDNLVGTDDADAIRSLGGSYDKMFGGEGADQFIFGSEANNGERGRSVIMDYEVGIDAIVLEDGASVGSIRESRGQAIVYLEDDRDAIYVRGDGVTAENLSIITEDAFQLV